MDHLLPSIAHDCNLSCADLQDPRRYSCEQRLCSELETLVREMDRNATAAPRQLCRHC